MSLASGIVGNVWNAVLMLAVTPVFVKNMGVEAYGLISLIAVLQVAVGALDFGLGASITREIARSNEDNLDGITRLLGALGSVYWLMALFVGLVLYYGSGVIQHFLGMAQSIPSHILLQSVELIAVYLAIRWPVAYYAGVLTGMQQLGLLNALKSGNLTLRWIGGVVIASSAPDIILVLNWFVLTAVFELLLVVIAARYAFPLLPLLPTNDFSPLKSVWRFSASMYAISLIAMLLTQVDRLAVSGYLGLVDLGFYSVAYSLAAGMTLIQTALNASALPAYSSSVDEVSRQILLRRYHKFSHITGWIMAPALAALMIFAGPIVSVWIDDSTAQHTLLPIALLAIGFYLNAIYSNIYLLGVASGNPGFFLRANIAGIVLYAIALSVGIYGFGIAGAASAWVALNVYYVAVVLPLAHLRFELGSALAWLGRHCVVFVLIALIVFISIDYGTAFLSVPWKVFLGLFCGMATYALLSIPFVDPAVRSDVIFVVRRLFFGKAL